MHFASVLLQILDNDTAVRAGQVDFLAKIWLLHANVLGLSIGLFATGLRLLVNSSREQDVCRLRRLHNASNQTGETVLVFAATSAKC
ncbi:hypothetical protein B0E49_04085 [Polaromonas sp. C04]|nr:hypothetical protein B0E49_04085 [Polaromonas sp. C04]